MSRCFVNVNVQSEILFNSKSKFRYIPPLLTKIFLIQETFSESKVIFVLFMKKGKICLKAQQKSCIYTQGTTLKV